MVVFANFRYPCRSIRSKTRPSQIGHCLNIKSTIFLDEFQAFAHIRCTYYYILCFCIYFVFVNTMYICTYILCTLFWRDGFPAFVHIRHILSSSFVTKMKLNENWIVPRCFFWGERYSNRKSRLFGRYSIPFSTSIRPLLDCTRPVPRWVWLVIGKFWNRVLILVQTEVYPQSSFIMCTCVQPHTLIPRL